MKTYRMPVKHGDVIVTRGFGNPPGAGGVISTVVVTDSGADGHVPGMGGYDCRDATPAEIQKAKESGRIHHTYG